MISAEVQVGPGLVYYLSIGDFFTKKSALEGEYRIDLHRPALFVFYHICIHSTFVFP